MKIIDIIRQGKPVFSFEFFPPKDIDGFDQLFKTIDNLKPLKPAFVSVTYGAGGSTRSKTIELVRAIAASKTTGVPKLIEVPLTVPTIAVP